jgi:hypothetical protein
VRTSRLSLHPEPEPEVDPTNRSELELELDLSQRSLDLQQGIPVREVRWQQGCSGSYGRQLRNRASVDTCLASPLTNYTKAWLLTSNQSLALLELANQQVLVLLQTRSRL